MTTATALNRTLVNWLATAPDEVLACRDIGHMWPARRPPWLDEFDNNVGGLIHVRKMQCGRCGLLRRERLDFKTKDDLGTRYAYPMNDNGEKVYLLPKGSGSLRKHDIVLFELDRRPPMKAVVKRPARRKLAGTARRRRG